MLLNFLLTIIFIQASFSFSELLTYASQFLQLGMPSKEAKTETEIYPVTTKAKIRKCSI